MRRTTILVSATLATLAAFASLAQAISIPDREFEGQIEHDSEVRIGFDVKGAGDNRKVTHVTFIAPLHCEGGASNLVLYAFADRLRVKPDGRFGRRLTDGGPVTRWGSSVLDARLHGRVVSPTKARGTVSVKITDETLRVSARRGGVNCYTGGLGWRAHS